MITHPNTLAREDGFSLVELMVAMVIGVFLAGAVGSLYLSSRTNFAYQDALSRMQENARFALQTMERDIRMAGYKTCGNLNSDPNEPKVISNIIIGGASSWATDPRTAIFGYDGSAAPPPFPNALANTDAFYVLGASGEMDLPILAHDPVTATLTTPAHNFVPGMTLMISSCEATAIFQMSGPSNPNGTATTIEHNTGGGISPGNCSKILAPNCVATSPTPPNFGSANATISQIYANAYYIAPSQIANNGNSLWSCSITGQVSGVAQCNELATGVEDMQITYGVDTNTGFNNMSTRGYLAADSITMNSLPGTPQTSTPDWQRVTSVQIRLLMASPPSAGNLASTPQQYRYNGATVTASDRRIRHEFSTLVTLRNRAQ